MTAEQMGLGLGGPEDDGVHRLFFALWPEPPLRERIAAVTADLEREHAPGGRRLELSCRKGTSSIRKTTLFGSHSTP